MTDAKINEKFILFVCCYKTEQKHEKEYKKREQLNILKRDLKYL